MTVPPINGVDSALDALPKRYMDGVPRLPKEFDVGKFGDVAGVHSIIVRNILDATYLFYTAHGEIPTPEQISEICGKSDRGVAHSKALIVKVLDDDVFWRILSSRGITRPAYAGLTSKQMLAISVISDPSRRTDLRTRLRSVGATYAEYRAWMRNPLFEREFKKVAGTNLADNVDNIKTVMLAGALSGDLNKAKFVMELSGEYDPNRKEVIQLQVVISNLLEVITRVVTDPQQLATLAGEIQKTLSTQGVTIKGEIT